MTGITTFTPENTRALQDSLNKLTPLASSLSQGERKAVLVALNTLTAPHEEKTAAMASFNITQLPANKSEKSGRLVKIATIIGNILSKLFTSLLTFDRHISTKDIETKADSVNKTLTDLTHLNNAKEAAETAEVPLNTINIILNASDKAVKEKITELKTQAQYHTTYKALSQKATALAKQASTISDEVVETSQLSKILTGPEPINADKIQNLRTAYNALITKDSLQWETLKDGYGKGDIGTFIRKTGPYSSKKYPNPSKEIFDAIEKAGGTRAEKLANFEKEREWIVAKTDRKFYLGTSRSNYKYYTITQEILNFFNEKKNAIDEMEISAEKKITKLEKLSSIAIRKGVKQYNRDQAMEAERRMNAPPEESYSSSNDNYFARSADHGDYWEDHGR